MITSGSFAPTSTKDSGYYTPGSKYTKDSKYTTLLQNTVFGKLQRRKLPKGLNVVSTYLTQPSLSKKLTGKESENYSNTVGLYNVQRLESAGFKHGSYVIGYGL